LILKRLKNYVEINEVQKIVFNLKMDVVSLTMGRDSSKLVFDATTHNIALTMGLLLQ
jgi:hypothetical protein